MATQLQTEQGIVRVPTGTWQIDPKHSSVEFHVKHMMIATVRGRFKEFEGTIEAAPDINDSRVYGLVKAASIDTTSPPAMSTFARPTSWTGSATRKSGSSRSGSSRWVAPSSTSSAT